MLSLLWRIPVSSRVAPWLLGIFVLPAIALPAKPQSQPAETRVSAPRVIPALKPLVPIQLSAADKSSGTTELGVDDRIWGSAQQRGDRTVLLAAVNHSLRYLQTAKAAQDYRSYSVPGITRDRVQRSLRRFRQLLLTARSATELQAAVEREFM